MRRTFTGISILVVAALLFSCNKPTSPKPGEGPGETSVIQSAKIYPHTNEFKTTRLHGQTFYQDRQLCAKCHGADYTGGQAGVSCMKCHEGFPHRSDWSVPENHGAKYLSLKDDQRKQCMTCHGGEKPTSGVSCTSCHRAFPHSDEFIAGGHQAMAKSSEGKCLTCHEDVKKNHPEMADKVSCTTCHGNAFPHSAGWAVPQKHGALFVSLSADNRKQCLTCHEGDSPSSGVNCTGCHKAFPHSDEFKAGAHADLAKSYDGQCILCHTDMKRNMPNFADQGCKTCHTGNLDIGWKGAKHPPLKKPVQFFTKDIKEEPRKPTSARKPSNK